MIRNSICSRFDDGLLFEIDVNAFHLVILANIVKYDFERDCNIHEYLAKQYFPNEEITK